MADFEEDKKIVEKFLAGDEAAFSGLVKKYLSSVYNFLFQLVRDRSVLDDLTQIAFIKAWKNIRRFDREKNFKTWLFTIAKNTAYDFLKKKKATPFSFFEDSAGYNKLEEISEEEILPDEILMRQDLKKELEATLEKIPEKYRIILLMRYRDDFSLQEIAEILGLPYNTIKSQHKRALDRLKKELLEKTASELEG